MKSPTTLIFQCLALLAVGLLLALGSCTPNEEIVATPANGLTFSTDTVSFDTVFTSTSSITERVRVVNPNSNAVNINSISVAGGNNSPYRLRVKGVEGKRFEDVLLRGGDSLLLLVEVTIDPANENLPFLVKDSLVFNTGFGLQDIKLRAYGQDAVFYPKGVLPCNTTWTADRPIVVMDTLVVDSACVLNIEPGARVYFEPNGALFMLGSLDARGLPGQDILFRNSRLDQSVESAPGQWLGLFFLPGSQNNRLDYCTIRNGTWGINLGAPADNDTIPEVVLNNCLIENMSAVGILSFSSDLQATNTLVRNCQDYTVGNFAGGSYVYQHCTFVNYSFTFFRQTPSIVFADNLVLGNNQLLTADLDVDLLNCIIWGSLDEELVLSNEGSSAFRFFPLNSIIKTELEGLDINNNLINVDPAFISPFETNFGLRQTSPAINAGAELGILIDLTGEDREGVPDIGAIEFTPEEG